MTTENEEQACPHCGAPGSHRLLALAADNQRLRVENRRLRGVRVCYCGKDIQHSGGRWMHVEGPWVHIDGSWPAPAEDRLDVEGSRQAGHT